MVGSGKKKSSVIINYVANCHNDNNIINQFVIIEAQEWLPLFFIGVSKLSQIILKQFDFGGVSYFLLGNMKTTYYIIIDSITN